MKTTRLRTREVSIHFGDALARELETYATGY
jgi:hypothetical protein